MPRPGGESGKLGDRYEAIWTVDSLLDVLVGEALGIVVEPFDSSESLGTEFKKELAAGAEFHSAKRQTTSQLWSIAELMRLGDSGRSVLGDLFSKLELDPNNRVVFVSGTTARDLEELCEAANTSQDSSAFEKRLDAVSRKLHKEFETRILRPQFNGSLPDAWHALRRIRVVGWNEGEMIRRVDQRIRGALYRTDGASFDTTAVRCLLADMVFGRFGQSIRRQEIITYLAAHNVAERDWARECGLRELVEKRNTAYIGHVEAELIANERIARDEAEKAVEALVDGGKKRVVIIGAAGLGKSCTVAQTLAHLCHDGIPALALRLDIQTEVLTSRRFGEELGLPESPVLVLAGISNGGRCVLVLDQLDAISFASGRNQGLWGVFVEMLTEARSYPQMRVLLACRAFDAENDPRLRRLLADIDNTLRIDLGIFPVEMVKRLVRENVRIDPESLDPAHLELLRAPLHLSLYLQGDPQSHPRFSGVQELLGRYWTHKRRLITQQLGRETRWHEIIRSLVIRLSRDQTLSAPRTHLDPFDETEIGVMASHNVIVLDGESVRFFHEAFFDYCCARLFEEQGKTLLEFLIDGGREQHLFRRAQVRQILGYEREHNNGAYMRDLHAMLTDARIRYHLKKLTLDWLGGLAEPEDSEWRLLEALNPASPIGLWARRVPWGRPAWVPVLLRLGVWEKWLESSNTETVQLAVRMLSLPDVVKACPIEVARLFRPYIDEQKTWREEFRELFAFGVSHHSRDMFELLRDATRRQLLGSSKSHDWYHYERLAQEKPLYAVELLAVMLDLESSSDANEAADEESERIGVNFIIESARGAPEDFVRSIMPHVIENLKAHDPDGLYGRSGRRLSRHTLSREGDTPVVLENGLAIAFGFLAREQPQILDSFTSAAEELPHKAISELLLSAWMENGVHYADKIVGYLLHDTNRFDIGPAMWGSGNGIAAIGRAAVRSASSHCSEVNYVQIEAAILGFRSERERREPKWCGYRRMLLLECLPPTRITREARLHFDELKRKFPWEEFKMPSSGSSVGFVGPPIPKEAVMHMTDMQWVEAMRAYAADRNSRTVDFLKGGKHELSMVLREQAQVDKPRFAQLALCLEDTIAPEYFNAILSGISKTTLDTGGGPKLPASALEPLDAEVAARVIVRVHTIGAAECARDICWAIRSLAEKSPPHGIIPVVCHYAMNDPDPKTEQWQEKSGGSLVWGGDPHFHGMNSVRGAAAEALGSLLFADPSSFVEIESAVLSVVHDRSIAVRSCAMVCLVAMINFDRERAVRLFLELCNGADAVLDTHYSEQFIYHATYQHYQSLRHVLLRMLMSEDEGARAIAGRQITLAAFHDPLAVEDVQQVLSADDVCRKAAAGIYAHNLGREAARAICQERLASLFNDSDPKVRASASDCFRLLPAELLVQEQNLMFQFIESPACLENSHDLIHALEESAEPLPEVICRVPERLIAEQRSQGQSIESRRWTHHLPALIARLYEQTPDADIKSRCLDIIDGMLELGFSEIEKELAQVER